MGENQGVIWVLIGALVLGVAIFAMGSYFSTQTESQQISIAFQQQAGVDDASCKASGGKFTVDNSLNTAAWTSGTVAAATAPDYGLSTGICDLP